MNLPTQIVGKFGTIERSDPTIQRQLAIITDLLLPLGISFPPIPAPMVKPIIAEDEMSDS